MTEASTDLRPVVGSSIARSINDLGGHEHAHLTRYRSCETTRQMKANRVVVTAAGVVLLCMNRAVGPGTRSPNTRSRPRSRSSASPRFSTSTQSGSCSGPTRWPTGPDPYYAVFDMWAPVWHLLTPDASLNVRQRNYERLFDEGRRRVRAWEAANVH